MENRNMPELLSSSVFITPDIGKRLIAKAIASLPEVRKAALNHTVVIITGTTNGYLASELLSFIGINFDKTGFYRGITVPTGTKVPSPEKTYDVVIKKGKYIEGLTIFDAAPDLSAGDIVFKGANAVNLETGDAGVLVGNPAVGTSLPVIQSVFGKRVKLIIPVGVEKRVEMPISELAHFSLENSCSGPTLCPIYGDVFTEIDALDILFDVSAEIMASGGVLGAEGGCYFLCTGERKDLSELREYLKQASALPPFSV